MTQNSHRFFKNIDCQYFPCHEYCDPDSFNCLFCYCPLYFLGDQCGGNFEYVGTIKKIKSCVHCVLPHDPQYYEVINIKLKQVIDERAFPKSDER